MAVPKQCAESLLEKVTTVFLQLLLYQGEGLLKKWLKKHLCLSGSISSWEKKRPSISRAVNLVTPATTKSHFNLFLQFLYTLPSVYCKDVLTSKIPVRQIAVNFGKRQQLLQRHQWCFKQETKSQFLASVFLQSRHSVFFLSGYSFHLLFTLVYHLSLPYRHPLLLIHVSFTSNFYFYLVSTPPNFPTYEEETDIHII